MAKRNALEENLQTIMGETAKNISRGVSGKGTQNEATEAEKDDDEKDTASAASSFAISADFSSGSSARLLSRSRVRSI